MTVHFETGAAGRKLLRPKAPPPKLEAHAGRILHLAKLMALAIKYDKMIQKGLVRDYSDLARLGGVTPARMTQIMGMLNLAPDIQEALLFLPLVEKGRDPIPERVLWRICGEKDWGRQLGGLGPHRDTLSISTINNTRTDTLTSDSRN